VILDIITSNEEFEKQTNESLESLIVCDL